MDVEAFVALALIGGGLGATAGALLGKQLEPFVLEAGGFLVALAGFVGYEQVLKVVNDTYGAGSCKSTAIGGQNANASEQYECLVKVQNQFVGAVIVGVAFAVGAYLVATYVRSQAATQAVAGSGSAGPNGEVS